QTLESLRLVDHIDAMMCVAVPGIVDQVIGDQRRTHRQGIDLGDQPARVIRKLDATVKHDLVAMQLCYDRTADLAGRTAKLKRAIRFGGYNAVSVFRALAIAGVIGLAILIGY